MIDDIVVYDPKMDDITYERFSKAAWDMFQKDPFKALSFYSHIRDKAIRSEVFEDYTLGEFLEDDYFKYNPDVYAVVFLDGFHFCSCDYREFEQLDLTRIATECDAVPLIFYRMAAVVTD
jgi:hypothetical protein